MLESKHYFIDLINSSKAYAFTSYYHYSGVGFKKAQINQGIFRKEDNKLVGVLQWGISAQENIKLDRYVKEPLTNKEYLELNRFCMADEEGKNAESEAIALGIKWIKINRPDIKLLVSYAGRKEGNYGYIYQATSWEYLGYFISDGFWLINGVERHQITLWYAYKRHADTSNGFRDGICGLYDDVRQTWSKQFIYIKRLNKKLTPASPILPYPKPTNEYPICTKIKVYKEGNNTQAVEKGELPNYYWIKDEPLFSKRTLIRRGELTVTLIAIYDRDGLLIGSAKSLSDAAAQCGLTAPSVRKGIKDNSLIKKQFYFREYQSDTEPADEIEVSYVATIDGVHFVSQTDIAEYCGVTRQAVSFAKLHGGKTLGGKIVLWS